MPTITIYGSSQAGPDDAAYQAAESIARGLALKGYAVMSGGYLGVMEAVSKGARAGGGRVIGVTTNQIGDQFNLKPNAYLDEIVNFPDLRDRPAVHGGECRRLPGDAGRNRHIA